MKWFTGIWILERRILSSYSESSSLYTLNIVIFCRVNPNGATVLAGTRTSALVVILQLIKRF